MHILTVNCGSSSLKVDIIDYRDGVDAPLVSVHLNGVGKSEVAQVRIGGSTAEGLTVPVAGYREAATAVLSQLQQRGLLTGVDAVGHRVVHGGPDLNGPVPLSDATVAAIGAVAQLAPLHNGPALAAIRAAREVLPDVPQVATFDTAFFRDLPAVASTYAIPSDVAASLGVRRYGFHGLAHRFMSERIAALNGRSEGRLVTLQLGAGCSAAAVLDGRPVDTSMGFTPLEGLVMATRSGDIDPSLPFYLAERLSSSNDAVEALLNERSGLAGISGGEPDMGRLLERMAAGDRLAALAVDVFCFRIRKYIGAYAAVLGGLDGLVFGGGIGENAAEVRARVCTGFEWLGLQLDPAANVSAPGSPALISKPGSRVQVWVVAVDEAALIAADTAACISNNDCGDSHGGN